MRRRDNSYPWLKMPYEILISVNLFQRFQLAIQSAKVRLDLAISPGLWLLPSKMVVNTESVVGYNNKLKKATSFMRIGVNSDLNIPVRRSAQKHNLGSRARLNYHTLVLKRETAEPVRQRSWRKPSTEQRKRRWLKAKKSRKAKKARKAKKSEKSEVKAFSTSHENNLNVLIIVAGALAWFLFR